MNTPNILQTLLYTTIISMQPDHHIYSLRSILDSDRIDPDLCRLMLHQIKSPLLDHSFQMTADDDITQNNNMGSLINDRNGRHYSTSKLNPPDHNHLDSYSVTNSYYETSRKADPSPQTINPTRGNMKQLQQKFAESIVSPLDHYKFLSKESSNQNIFHIFFDEGKKQEPKMNGPGLWCGGIFNPNLQEYSKQVLMDPQDFQYVRRKIFKNKSKPTKQASTKSLKRSLTFEESVERLQKIEEPELANFIKFISKCLPNLQKLVPYYKNLNKNQFFLNQMLLQGNPVNYETRQSYQNKDRICNRMQSYRVSEMLKKLASQAGPSKTNANRQMRDYIQSDVEYIFEMLNEVEDSIQCYVSRQQSMEQLKIVHGLLYQSINTKVEPPSSPIQNLQAKNQKKMPKNINNHSLKIKLLRLLSSLNIDEYLYENLGELRYIWADIQQPGGYDDCSRFIKQLSKNDILISPASLPPNEKSFVDKDNKIIKKLQMEGFVKNT